MARDTGTCASGLSWLARDREKKNLKPRRKHVSSSSSNVMGLQPIASGKGSHVIIKVRIAFVPVSFQGSPSLEGSTTN